MYSCFSALQMHLLFAFEFLEKPSGIAERQIRQNLGSCTFFIPSLGTKCSLGGNKVFPSWESIVPLLGTFLLLWDTVFIALRM